MSRKLRSCDESSDIMTRTVHLSILPISLTRKAFRRRMHQESRLQRRIDQEMWGTIKTCRYRNSEVVRDANNPSSFEYTGLMIDNDKHLLRYDSSDRTIIIPSGHKLYKTKGEPTEQVPFEEFCKRAAEAGYQISFAKYQFEVE